MGHIKEPNGVDLIINSRMLTTEEEITISNYIRAYKSKYSNKGARKSRKHLSTKRTGKTITRKRPAA